MLRKKTTYLKYQYQYESAIYLFKGAFDSAITAFITLETNINVKVEPI